MSKKITFAEGEYYHLYNRGTEKRTLFLDRQDHRRFLILLHLCNNSEPIHWGNLTYPTHRGNYRGQTSLEMFNFKPRERLTSIGAYCLMSNHFHLLTREQKENGITKFIQKLLTAYSMYFNKKYKRSGRLFEGKFKSEHANDDRYLKYLFSYIHLNPIKIIEPEWKEKVLKQAQRDKMLAWLKRYEYSSLPEYLADRRRPEKVILTRDAFPDYFNDRGGQLAELLDWLNYNEV